MASQLYARTVARALEKHLNGCPESSIHWVQCNKELPWEKPSLVWPQDTPLGYLVTEGQSEGMQVHVTAQSGVYENFGHAIVLTCKFLCGDSRAFVEAARVRDFIESMDCAALLSSQPK